MMPNASLKINHAFLHIFLRHVTFHTRQVPPCGAAFTEAYLRLSRNVSKAKRDQLVERLLEDLHLEERFSETGAVSEMAMRLGPAVLGGC